MSIAPIDSNKRGEWVETLFAAQALRQNLDTFKPTGNGGPVDWVVGHKNSLARVQVRCATAEQNGRYHACKTTYLHNGVKTPLGPKQIDLLAAYVVPSDTWYVIPARIVAKLGGRIYFGQAGKYDEFREAWHLFKTPPPRCNQCVVLTTEATHTKIIPAAVAAGEASQALRERAQPALSDQQSIEPELTLTYDDPLNMAAVLTASRLRLLRQLYGRAVPVSALANRLKRDLKSVRRDVKTLENAGVLRTRLQLNPGHGRVKLVEPVAKQIKLLANL